MAVSDKLHSIQLEKPNEATGACWSCGDMRAAHFCKSCGSVQPAVPTDYFSFFGLPRNLNLDVAKLERDFYQFSRKLHPDVFASASGKEQEWSLQKTSQLNDAYRTLKDPIARTEYLLKLEGVHLEEQSKSATEAARQSGEVKKQVVPPDLLEEVFELNMQLEEARMNKKMGEADESLTRDLQQTKEKLQAKFDALDTELKRYWNDWDSVVARNGSEDERKPVRDKMLDLLNRRTYIRNLVRDVNEVLE
ncbi:MAG TPA: Fe-S protein assembly co-chaperone HscB [Terriglobales bacterium]|nr:Fe-S protein assembly co-chaperone HscB [Terriglobales bacterium]